MPTDQFVSDLRINRQAFACVMIIGVLVPVSGCHLLNLPLLNSENLSDDASDFRLPPIVASKEAVQLEILFVDRPRDDSLLGDALWKEVDQIAGMSAETRGQLRKNGWRVGHASSHPPRALEELLELSSGRQEVIDSERRLVGRRIALPAGGDFPIELTSSVPEVKLQHEAGGETKTYSNARCILKVRIDREQDGWVRLKFTPEVHHGQNWLRPVATPLDWARRRTQLVAPLYNQQFSLSLNVGEMAVITAEGDEATTAGSSFFRSIDESGALQRLLVVRVANMRKLTPVYDD